MKLSGMHLLLTYQCTFECDHCFVWGSPRQSGVMSVENIRTFLRQARETGTVDWVYFEGGEPFLYYPILVRGIQLATSMGFHVGLVTNAYWADTLEDAVTWLKPFVEMVEDLSVSCDIYHDCDGNTRTARNAIAAAEQLGIPGGIITVEPPEPGEASLLVGQLPEGESGVMFRGRAASCLVAKAPLSSWKNFNQCTHEDLREPGRVHIDPFGNVHICQGILLGNVFKTPLKHICAEYEPEEHPIVGPLLRGGPVGLLKEYGLAHKESYADNCHLCYEARLSLRDRFPEFLAPDNVYGVIV